jgi:hypothetical protein
MLSRLVNNRAAHLASSAAASDKPVGTGLYICCIAAWMIKTMAYLSVCACCHQLALIWMVNHAQEEGVGKQALQQ